MAYSQDALKLFDDLVRHEVEDKEIPSISYVLVDRNGMIADGHVARADNGFAFGPESCFRIGSVTKTFTGVALMQLAEKGLLDLDAPVETYIPGFAPINPFKDNPGGPNGTDVTLRKLISHTAGMVREPKSGHYLDDKRPPLEETVRELGSSVLKDDPSLGIMHYSNAGIAVAGYVLERVAGQDYASYVTQHILAPLGMKDTRAGMAPGVRERLAPADMWTVDEDSPAPVFNLGGSPAGNIFSTTRDMAAYAQCLLRGGFAPDGTQVISPASLAEMWRVVGRRPEGYSNVLKGYGLCFGVGQMDGWKSVGHGGAVYGYSTQFQLLPEAGIGICIFSTLDMTNQIATRLASDGLRILLSETKQGKVPSRAQRPTPIQADQLEALPGNYRSAEGEIVEIRRKGDKLFLMGDGVPLQIRPAGGVNWLIDGRLYGREADYPHLALSFPETGVLTWKGTDWQKLENLEEPPVPDHILPHLGEYGPDFNITYLTYSHGKLRCLIEYFFTHSCEPEDDLHYRMHGGLYEEEVLELGAVDEDGRKGIRVGPMFLVRRD